MPNYEALRTGAQAAVNPTDGPHQATLERANLVETQKGEQLVTDWSEVGGQGATWTSWNRFDEQGWAYTIDFLDGLGIDRGKLADIDGHRLEDELETRVGTVFNVRTTSSMGRNGDRVFVNTYLDGKADVRDTSDVPIEGVVVPATTDDLDIPF